MEKFIITLPLSDCWEQVAELQDKLLTYSGREVEVLRNGASFEKDVVLKKLSVGGFINHIADIDLAIGFDSTTMEGFFGYKIIPVSRLEVDLTPNNIVFFFGRPEEKELMPKNTYEFRFY